MKGVCICSRIASISWTYISLNHVSSGLNGRGSPSLAPNNPSAQQQPQHILHVPSALHGSRFTGDGLRAYAGELLHTTRPSWRPSTACNSDSLTAAMPSQGQEPIFSSGEIEEEPSCREAVEILTRNPKKRELSLPSPLALRRL